MSNVDLSKAKTGDTVVFRCGGRAVVSKITIGAKGATLSFVGSEWSDFYMNDGCKFSEKQPHYMDITEVIPTNVAPMTYKTKERMIEALNWIENNWDKTSEAEMFQAIKEAKIHLTRAPEHDVEGV